MIKITGPLLAIIAMCSIVATRSESDEIGCQRKTVAVVASPNSDRENLVAVMHEDWCSNGGFVTVATNTIQILPLSVANSLYFSERKVKSPWQDSSNVLILEAAGGGVDYIPQLKWKAYNSLQISIPNLSNVMTHVKKYQEVDIAIKYEPDDPDARFHWNNRNKK
jgi:hypothetical protein